MSLLRYPWIRAETTTAEQLQSFVWAIAGSPTLPPIPIPASHKLKIQLNLVSEQIPVFHTCFKQMDMPAYGTCETFKEKLELSLAAVRSGVGAIGIS